MSYSIRPAVPGDEQTVFALIEALARYARLAHELSGSVEALRSISRTTPPFAPGPGSTWRTCSSSTITGGAASGGRCSRR
jgi:hypothetical protein